MDVPSFDPATTTRRTFAALWLGVLAAGVGGVVGHNHPLLLCTWLASVLIMIGTAATARLGKDEHLVHTRPYRLVAGALLVVALAGSVLGFVPGASDASQLYAVFFMPIAVLAYRSVVARGASSAVGTAAI